MDELEEENKLRQLARDYSKGVLSLAVYRAKRSFIIESYSRSKTASSMHELARSKNNLLMNDERQGYGTSLFAGATLFILAFMLGVGLGFLVFNVQYFPLECDAVWYLCISSPLSR